MRLHRAQRNRAAPRSELGRRDGTALSAALQLYLIRHGETAWSISGRHTGCTDIGLTAHGEEEARAPAPCLRTIQFTRILVSPLRRARQTCELAGFGDAAEIDPNLMEWNYGDYEGKRTVDIRQDRPGWNVWRDGCPQGETPANISDRADRLLDRLRESVGNAALFLHGQFGAALAAPTKHPAVASTLLTLFTYLIFMLLTQWFMGSLQAPRQTQPPQTSTPTVDSPSPPKSCERPQSPVK